ncbi:hypothetical protein [Massilia glaciei]|uniref:Ribosomal protein S3AE n=1 Tax=Massilia glaciei TaxID=1524097 RepID=A0A2U2HE63_9BURK|nr:hypothetical protein [Massilia glaciei]PWF41738.1 hypothetical protein C7C56_023980 [Massilia glaciei]
MSETIPFPIRKECPPGACVCDREVLLSDPAADLRVLFLTREEEKKLIERIEGLTTYPDLRKLEERLLALLGITLRITPSARGVRTVRGLNIQLLERPGLCRKTRENVPAALRRCLTNNPEIVYALLNVDGLFDDFD